MTKYVLSMMSMGFGVGCLMMGLLALAAQSTDLDNLGHLFLLAGAVLIVAPAMLLLRNKNKQNQKTSHRDNNFG